MRPRVRDSVVLPLSCRCPAAVLALFWCRFWRVLGLKQGSPRTPRKTRGTTLPSQEGGTEPFREQFSALRRKS